MPAAFAKLPLDQKGLPMFALQETEITGTVTWLGKVSSQNDNIRSAPLQQMPLSFAGTAGEHHAGETRASCVRVRNIHPKGTKIRNTRQLSVLSAEEMAQIAAEIGLGHLDPVWLGASLVIEGIPDFTHLPPSSRLQGPDGATLVVDVENLPCNWPGKEIERDHPGHGKPFKAAAKDRRGVTAWVEREGVLSVGDQLRLFVPAQRAWQG